MSDYWTNLTTELGKFWQQATVSTRVAVITTAAFVVAAVVGVGFWSSRPQYTTLVDRLAPSEVAEVMSKLQERGIACRTNLAATSVQVPKTQLSAARMAISDFLGPDGGARIPEPDGYFVGDPALRRYQLRRHKEEILAQNISQIEGVQQARVSISKPEPSPFLRDAQPTRANVMLDLRRGVSFTQEQATSIVMMMAHSVEGLEPERVSIVDTSGNQLASMRSPTETVLSDQYRYNRQLEADLAARAEWILSSYLGPGNARVRVTADVDFRESSLKSLTHDPEARAKRMERIYTKSGTQMRYQEAGPAGTASNVGSQAFGADRAPVSDREQIQETEYENARILETVREAPAVIRRLTVAAVVDLTDSNEHDQNNQTAGVAAGGAPGPGMTARPEVSKEDIETILKKAVGFDEMRGDQIAVAVGTLRDSDFFRIPAAPSVTHWEWYRELLRNASLGIASIVALILGLLVVGRMRPAHLPKVAQESSDPDRVRRIAALSARTLEEPESLAAVLQAWLSGHDLPGDSGGESRPAGGREPPGAKQRPERMAA